MTPDDKITPGELALLRAAHHAYCRDTGCFDGDDISHPELLTAIRVYGAAERAAGQAAMRAYLDALDSEPAQIARKAFVGGRGYVSEPQRLKTERET